MNIISHIENFQNKSRRYKPYSKICKALLTGGKPYSLNTQFGYGELTNLPECIRKSVKKYSSNKDNAILLYKDLVSYLQGEGVDVPYIEFPPVPVSNTFERLMFIAKYLQDEEHRISDLEDVLWVSDRQIEDDLSRLRGRTDPIQVCGKKFFIKEDDAVREKGRIRFASTAHPVFLSENLTQVMVMLKGLKEMAKNPLYRPYALESGREIWRQLSPYAKKRIMYVLESIMDEDIGWLDQLKTSDPENSFHTEEACSRIHNSGASVVLDCMKNGKSFCVEYADESGETRIYKDCVVDSASYRDGQPGIAVNCSAGRVRILTENVIRSAYTVEELMCI